MVTDSLKAAARISPLSSIKLILNGFPSPLELVHVCFDILFRSNPNHTHPLGLIKAETTEFDRIRDEVGVFG
jgi:hypothetical protein